MFLLSDVGVVPELPAVYGGGVPAGLVEMLYSGSLGLFFLGGDALHCSSGGNVLGPLSSKSVFYFSCTDYILMLRWFVLVGEYMKLKLLGL